ncbi:MAG TPA: carbohydrate binding domain-containing protein [Candidatus Sulfotelmatobacter sp.]|nr:carbohydrate binding domain-containing protein [Candidatus Sulfotelmatobacter sp.]
MVDPTREDRRDPLAWDWQARPHPTEMQINLRSPIRRLFFSATSLLVVALYLLFAGRAFWAAHLAAQPDRADIEKSIDLEPGNSQYRAVLARNLALSVADLDSAISNLKTAVQLNPYQSSYWLDLAGAYQLAGRTDEQVEAIQRAAAADPMTPHVAWQAANFFLVQGDVGKALPYFRTVFANDPDSVNYALQLCWRASGDPHQMFALALPQNPELYLSFLRLLVAKQEIDAAKIAWDQLISLQKPFPVLPALPYLRLLIANHEVTPAIKAWQQLADVDEQVRPYLASPANLMVNGGFEETLLNGGFDWWYEPNPHAKLAIDTDQFFSGTRSLSVSFDGRHAHDAGLAQFVPVKPGTEYEFSAVSKTLDIDSASGPRFVVGDAYTLSTYALTDDLLGSTPWHKQQARFRTGPQTNLVFVKITRDPPGPLIRGKLWVDDIKLVERNSPGRNQ